MKDQEFQAMIQELETQRNIFATRCAQMAVSLAKLEAEKKEWQETQPKSSDSKQKQTSKASSD